jgi:hypothetical protein
VAASASGLGGRVSAMGVGTIPRVHGPFERAEDDLVLQGAHHPYVVSDPSRRWWVLKPLQARGILAESIGGLLGRLIGVEVPEFAVFDEDGRRGWLSAFVREAHHWDRSRVSALTNPNGIGRMLALDAIIHNEDRNTENFILEPQDELESFRCWAIDMESALVGMPRAFASKGNKAPRPYALPADLVVDDEMRGTASEAALVAAGASEAAIREIVAIAMETAGTLDGEVLSAALLARCRHAPQIVEDYLGQIPRA